MSESTEKQQHHNVPAVRATTAIAMPITNMEELSAVGQLLAQSGMFGVNSPAQGFVVAATCHQQGISLMEFQRSYHIVEGRPSMRADAMLAELRKRGGKHKIIENSVERAEIEVEFDGQTLRFAYSMADAERTGDCFKGSTKDKKAIWIKRPEDMLWARCISRAVRRMCPEIVAGLYTPEEVMDFDDAPRRAAPAEISEEEAARRAKTVAGEIVEKREQGQERETAQAPAQDTAPAPKPELKYSRCPDGFGDLSGQRWDEMDVALLEQAAECEQLSKEFRGEVKRVIAEKLFLAGKSGGAE